MKKGSGVRGQGSEKSRSHKEHLVPRLCEPCSWNVTERLARPWHKLPGGLTPLLITCEIGAHSAPYEIRFFTDTQYPAPAAGRSDRPQDLGFRLPTCLCIHPVSSSFAISPAATASQDPEVDLIDLLLALGDVA